MDTSGSAVRGWSDLTGSTGLVDHWFGSESCQGCRVAKTGNAFGQTFFRNTSKIAAVAVYNHFFTPTHSQHVLSLASPEIRSKLMLCWYFRNSRLLTTLIEYKLSSKALLTCELIKADISSVAYSRRERLGGLSIGISCQNVEFEREKYFGRKSNAAWEIRWEMRLILNCSQCVCNNFHYVVRRAHKLKCLILSISLFFLRCLTPCMEAEKISNQQKFDECAVEIDSLERIFNPRGYPTRWQPTASSRLSKSRLASAETLTSNVFRDGMENSSKSHV